MSIVDTVLQRMSIKYQNNDTIGPHCYAGLPGAPGCITSASNFTTINKCNQACQDQVKSGALSGAGRYLLQTHL